MANKLPTSPPPAATPPPEPSWHRLGKSLIISFVFTVAVFFLAPSRLKDFEGAVEYGYSSVNIATLYGHASERLRGVRYHWRVWSLSKPFNLSRACERLWTSAPPEDLHPYCAGSPVITRLERSPVFDFMARPAEPPTQSVNFITVVGSVDETKYPRWAGEYVLGLPDSIIYALGCAWRGIDACRPPAPAPTQGPASSGGGFNIEDYLVEPDATARWEPRSNWFGKLLLILACLVAAAAAGGFEKERMRPLVFAGAFLVGLLLAMLACLVILLVVKVLGALGQWLQSLLTIGITITPVVWVLDSVKDVLSDQVKNYMHRKAFGDRAAEAGPRREGEDGTDQNRPG